MPIIGYNGIGDSDGANVPDYARVLYQVIVTMSVNSNLGKGYLYCKLIDFDPPFGDNYVDVRMMVYEIGNNDANSLLVAFSNILSVSETTSVWREFTFPATILEIGKTYAVAFISTGTGVEYLGIAYDVVGEVDTHRFKSGSNIASPPPNLTGFAPMAVARRRTSIYVEYEELSIETDTSSITSTARIVDPNVFTFASPSTTVNKGRRNYNTFDIKLKHACNHYLSNIQYTLGKCPRCLGTGYYYDAKFNEMGRLIQISLEDKLQQALEKLVLTDENKFHTDVAIGLKKWLGEAPISKIKAIIKYDLMEGIATLKGSQKSIAGLSPRAQISSIDDIIITSSGVGGLHYTITVTTVSGEITNLEGAINFSNLVE